MERINKPKGLIRYASEENIVEKRPFQFTGRMRAYSGVLIVLLGVLITLLLIRSDFETTILRTPGILYQEREDGMITNLYQVKMVNKTNESMDVRFELLNPKGNIEMVGGTISLAEQGIGEGAFFVIIDPVNISRMSTDISVGVFSGEILVEKVKTKFLGPTN